MLNDVCVKLNRDIVDAPNLFLKSVELNHTPILCL